MENTTAVEEKASGNWKNILLLRGDIVMVNTTYQTGLYDCTIYR
jgi:hypothetical protein